MISQIPSLSVYLFTTGEIYRGISDWLTPKLEQLTTLLRATDQNPPKNWTTATVARAPKSEGSTQGPSAYRPITPLNIFYNIWTAVYARRLSAARKMITTHVRFGYKAKNLPSTHRISFPPSWRKK